MSSTPGTSDQKETKADLPATSQDGQETKVAPETQPEKPKEPDVGKQSSSEKDEKDTKTPAQNKDTSPKETDKQSKSEESAAATKDDAAKEAEDSKAKDKDLEKSEEDDKNKGKRTLLDFAADHPVITAIAVGTLCLAMMTISGPAGFLVATAAMGFTARTLKKVPRAEQGELAKLEQKKEASNKELAKEGQEKAIEKKVDGPDNSKSVTQEASATSQSNTKRPEVEQKANAIRNTICPPGAEKSVQTSDPLTPAVTPKVERQQSRSAGMGI